MSCPLCGHTHLAGPCPRPARPESARTLRASGNESGGLASGESFGRYEILSPLGRGGMGAVYKARDRELARDVALKVMLAGAVAGPDEIERFNREKTAVASLSHPHIVTLFDSGTHDGCPWFCMEYVDGRPLDVVLRRERLPLEQALGIVRDVARALQYAHEKGVVHRDVKPGNILVDPAGRPRLTDFGLARQVEGGSALTMSGEVLGTPQYMAPEQAAGKVRQIDARSDVWSLGAVMYEMLTLEPPHKGESMVEILRKAVETDVVPVRRLAPRVPKSVETICMKALERTKDRRYASAGEMADDVERFLRREPIRAVPPSTASRVMRWSQRNPLPAVVLLAAVFVGGPLAWWQATRPGTVDVRVTWKGAPLRPASVAVGGRALAVGDGGARGDVPAGAWEVRVRAPGFREGLGVVTVKRGGTHDVVVALEHEQGVFELDVEPKGASVFVDGADSGSKLRNFRIDTGPHDLLVRKEGCHDVRLRWDAAADRETRGVACLPRATAWSRRFRGPTWQMRWIGDVTGDGRPELLHREFSNFHCWDPWHDVEVWEVPFGAVAALPHETADFDGDGVLDVVAFLPEGGTERIVAWSGRPEKPGEPRRLWRVVEGPVGTAGAQTPTARPIVRDLDGDGTPDVFAASLWRDAVGAFSGRDGTALWTGEVRGRPLFAAAAGDRIFVVTDAEAARLDPATGRVVWRVAVPVLDLAGEPATLRAIVAAAVPGHAFADAVEFDGAPGADLLVHAWPAPGGKPVLRAFAGDGGAALWTSPRLASWFALGPTSVADANGDGRADVLAVLDERDPARGNTHTMIDGATGRALWAFPVGGSCRLRAFTRPAELFLLELSNEEAVRRRAADGTVVARHRLPARMSGWPETGDWDGDGDDDLVALTEDGLTAWDRDGTLVGSCALEAPPKGLFPSPDADGDRVQDWLVMGEAPSVVLGPRALWTRRSVSTILARPLVLDADSDGALEVVVFAQIGAEEGLTLLDARTGLVRAVGPGWNMRAPVPVRAAGGGWDFLAVAQVSRKMLTALQLYRGADLSVVRTKPIPRSYASPLVADLDGDGAAEHGFASWDAAPRFTALRADTWETLWTCDGPMGGWDPPAAADLDGDGAPEAFGGFLDGHFAVLDGRSGAPRWTRDFGDRFSAAAVPADLDRDGRLELVVSAPFRDGGDLLGLAAADGAELWRVPGAAGARAPLVRDLDGDGASEILASSYAKGLLCLRADRSVLWSYAVPTTGEPHSTLADLVVDDLESDGKLEALVTFTDGSLRVLDAATGRLLWSFYTQEAHIEAGVCVADVDGDGVKEVFLAGNDRSLYCLKGLR